MKELTEKYHIYFPPGNSLKYQQILEYEYKIINDFTMKNSLI
jgi:hypothetical protein